MINGIYVNQGKKERKRERERGERKRVKDILALIRWSPLYDDIDFFLSQNKIVVFKLKFLASLKTWANLQQWLNWYKPTDFQN